MKRAGKLSDMEARRDGDSVVFEGLAHHFENVAGKLRQLVEKEAGRLWPRTSRGEG